MAERSAAPQLSPEPDALAALRALALAEEGLSCTISDALGRTNGLTADVAPMWRGAKLVGRAVTARVDGLDLSAVFRAIESCESGDVVVVGDVRLDDAPVRQVAYWGENASLAARHRGAVGAVIGAPCRDVAAHERHEFPVFATGAAPRGGLFGEGGDVGVKVTVGGVAVQPGDVIVGDENGVVVIPRASLAEVVAQIPTVLAKDRAVQRALLAGADMRAARASAGRA